MMPIERKHIKLLKNNETNIKMAKVKKNKILQTALDSEISGDMRQSFNFFLAVSLYRKASVG